MSNSASGLDELDLFCCGSLKYYLANPVPENKAMIQSITSLFEDGKISFKEGKVSIKSPVAGNRNGTYTLKNGIIDMEFGANSQVSLHIKNDGQNLAILFNEDGENETGKIILVKE